jgi:predicted HTH transcriptional regulator
MFKLLGKILKLFFIVAAVYGGFRLASKYKNGQLDFELPVEKPKPESKFKPARKLDLNSRQQQIYNLIKAQKQIDIADLKAVKGVTTRTLRRDLNKLMEEHLVLKQGKTKSARYILIEN